MDLLRSRTCFIFVAACMLFVFAACAMAQERKTSYNYQGKRDPFVPLISSLGYLLNLEPEENAALRLEGIMYDQKGDSMAIINGELVRVGEPIADAVVSSIGPTKVTIVKDNQKVELELRREE
jgi:hypothetical protein